MQQISLITFQSPHLTYPLLAPLRIRPHYSSSTCPYPYPWLSLPPKTSSRLCPLFLHSTAPGGFGAADFPFAHRCPVKCCDTVVFSGHPKNMSQKSPSPSLYFYTHPCTSCSFVKLINRYYVRPKYTQASFEALLLEGI